MFQNIIWLLQDDQGSRNTSYNWDRTDQMVGRSESQLSSQRAHIIRLISTQSITLNQSRITEMYTEHSVWKSKILDRLANLITTFFPASLILMRILKICEEGNMFLDKLRWNSVPCLNIQVLLHTFNFHRDLSTLRFKQVPEDGNLIYKMCF